MPRSGGGDVLLAHGVPAVQPLPIPLSFAVTGAALALVVSFVVLGFAWSHPRFEGAESGRPLPTAVTRVVDSPVAGGALSVVVLAFALYVVLAAARGPDSLQNPTFGVVYVLLWVGIVPVSIVLGPVWRRVNPLRTVHRVLALVSRTDPDASVRSLPPRLGHWPAAAALLAFVWLELASPDPASLGAVRLWFALYASALLVGASVYGRGLFAHADPFETYSSIVGRLSPWGRRTDGRLVVRNPLENLDSLPPAPGLAATMAVLLGSTAYDSVQSTTTWVTSVQSSSLSPVLLQTLGLCACILFVYLSYGLATVLSGVVGRTSESRWTSLPDLYAHSLVPIVVGYVLAHYLTFLVIVGQQTLVRLSDPLSRGWNVFGTADLGVSNTLLTHPTAIASFQVVAVVTGHVLGVISAHDRAVRVLPASAAVRGQLPLLVVMIVYTVGGLLLLFAP
jgi:hypothetical protein